MKLNLVVTSTGFQPATDDDYEKKRTLKNGSVVECTVKEMRNYKFHRLYFALINTAWSFLNERQQAFFKDDVEVFRKTVEISSGHFEPVYSTARKEWIEVPRSIAFDKLTEADFHNLYERVKDTLYSLFLKSVSKEDFESKLMYF